MLTTLCLSTEQPSLSAPILPASLGIRGVDADETIAQLVRNPPAMQETPVQFLGWQDLLEKG